MNNKCYFADEDGNYSYEVVSSERADSCDRKTCTCETHTIRAESGFAFGVTESEVTFEMLEQQLNPEGEVVDS